MHYIYLQRDIMSTQTEHSLSDKIEEKHQKKPVQCPWEGCGRLFKARFLLNRHMLIHDKVKKYKCEFCDKSFSLAQHWKEHTSIHTGEFPYICGIGGCTQKFRQGGKLSLHRRSHPEYVLRKYNYSLNPTKKSAMHSKATSKTESKKASSTDKIEEKFPIPEKRFVHPKVKI